MKARADTHPFTRPPRPKRKQSPAPDPRRQELRREADVDGHLSFVRELLKRHEIKRKARPELFRDLDKIEEHEREDRLFLGVVGEFSSGKSTLLNALLRDDLLRASIEQGTTSAATVISHGERLAVRLRRPRANLVVGAFRLAWAALTMPLWIGAALKKKDRDALREMIHTHTSHEAHARRLAQVEVAHPAECLRNGMVIVDLPGTNAENKRHGNVTAAALADFCDAAVIVVPADAAGSETMWTFLAKNLDGEVLRRCVFVLNKIDLVRPRDRAKLRENFEARLCRDFKLERPRIVACAPERVLEAAGILPPAGDDEATLAENREWHKSFAEAEALLWSTLHEQKLLLQVERVARLLDGLFGRLTAVLDERVGEYRKQHDALTAGLAQIPDLDGFVRSAVERHCESFGRTIEPVFEATFRGLVDYQKATLQGLFRVVSATGNRKQLQEALESAVPSILSSAQSSMQGLLRTAVKKLEADAEAEHRAFHAVFQKMYRNLATLGGRVRGESADRATAGTMAATAGAQTANLAAGVAELRMEDLWKKAGGAGVGAVIGTMVLPGVGTLLGGLMGGLFGALFGPSHQQIAQECWDKLESSVIAGFESFNEQARNGLVAATTSVGNRLEEMIEEYGRKYRGLVKEMIARDEKAAADLTDFRRRTESDLEAIRRRRAQLETARRKLRAL